jgi:hypothetical protein
VTTVAVIGCGAMRENGGRRSSIPALPSNGGIGKTHAVSYLTAEVNSRGDIVLDIDLRMIGSTSGILDSLTLAQGVSFDVCLARPSPRFGKCGSGPLGGGPFDAV